jgi:hypothetical protein
MSSSGETPLMLADDLRLKAALAIARHLNAHRAIVGDDRLAAGAVSLVALAFWLALTLTVTQVIAHLGAHRSLDDTAFLSERNIDSRSSWVIGPFTSWSRSSFGTSSSGVDIALAGGFRLLGILTPHRHDMPRTQTF